ncbi:MAG: EAL domain-containing protein [Tepidisphaeraceae bacterium]|jgi:EAL domain-containing protein (putative c-di-GMP-specific phosphodiesterase class I)
MSTAVCNTSVTAREIIECQGIVTYFQPILSARQRSIVGAEALSRGVVGVEALSRGQMGAVTPSGNLIPPVQLFRMASEEGLSLTLEKLCRTTAMQTFAKLPRNEDLILFLNFDAAALEQDQSCLAELMKEIADAGLNPRNVAIEILESAFKDTQRLQDRMEEFRANGFPLVLDDVGTGYSNLDRIPLIKPDILKLDRRMVMGIEDDYHRQETFKSLVQLSRRIGALVVAEGVETQRQAMMALELGADLLQGFFLGTPEHSDNFAGDDVAGRIDALARRYKSYMTSRINARKLQHRRFNIILNEVLCELAKCSADDFDDVLRTTISQYDNVECVYVMDEGGTQVSTTICNHRVPRRTKGIMFRPAPKGADHSLKEYYYVLLDVELQKYTTEPYVSLASGNLCRTISTCFRDSHNNKMFILCIDVLCE